MIRMSILRNYPVILGEQRVGLLQNFSLDCDQKQIEALIVSCGFRGKRIVLSENVCAIAEGFILVNAISKYRRSHESETCRFIRDTSGSLLGRITDYAIDEQTLSVQAVEMSLGYFPSERHIRIWVYEYARSSGNTPEIVVPAALGEESIRYKEGN